MIIGSAQQLCDPRYQVAPGHAALPGGRARVCRQHVLPALGPDFDHKEQEKFYVKYDTEELRELRQFLREITGKKMDWDRLAAVVDLTDRTWDLFVEAYELRKTVPYPMDTGDAMNTMVPSRSSRHPGMLRLLQGPERRAETEDRSGAGRGRRTRNTGSSGAPACPHGSPW